MANNRFQRGSGVFNCECCGRGTRNSGQPVDSKDCFECWEIAGAQNMMWDGYPKDEVIEYRDQHFNAAVEKGGNAEKIKAQYKELFDLKA